VRPDFDTDGITVVRIIDDRQLVGVFVSVEIDELLYHVDQVCDPSLCEFTTLPMLSVLWTGPCAPVPYPAGYFNGEDDNVEGFNGGAFHEHNDKHLERATWSALVQGTWVYFAKAGGRVKIGKAKDVKSRIATLQTGCPDRLELVKVVRGGVDIERGFHQQFAHLRETGEWFRIEGDLATFLEASHGRS
jgi:hypothetical protein